MQFRQIAVYLWNGQLLGVMFLKVFTVQELNDQRETPAVKYVDKSKSVYVLPVYDYS